MFRFRSAHKKYKLILDKKQEVSIAQLCQGCATERRRLWRLSRARPRDGEKKHQKMKTQVPRSSPST